MVPRAEVWILLGGLACTIWGKLTIITSGKLTVGPGQLSLVVLPDILFVIAVAVLISFLYVLKPSSFSARCALLISVVVSGWSVLNTGWLMRSGAQLQPGVVKVMLRDFKELWPFVQPFVAGSLWRSAGLIVVAVVVCGIVAYHLIRPRKVVGVRIHHVRWMIAKALVVAALFLAQSISKANSETSFATGVLSFSSHGHALARLVRGGSENPHSKVRTRNIARVGERRVVEPTRTSDKLPNIILVLLESISYEATSLCKPSLDTMPNLTRLAHEGAEFTLTRVPVAHTTQAFWATLTSSTPVIQAGNVAPEMRIDFRSREMNNQPVFKPVLKIQNPDVRHQTGDFHQIHRLVIRKPQLTGLRSQEIGKRQDILVLGKVLKFFHINQKAYPPLPI